MQCMILHWIKPCLAHRVEVWICKRIFLIFSPVSCSHDNLRAHSVKFWGERILSHIHEITPFDGRGGNKRVSITWLEGWEENWEAVSRIKLWICKYQKSDLWDIKVRCDLLEGSKGTLGIEIIKWFYTKIEPNGKGSINYRRMKGRIFVYRSW